MPYYGYRFYSPELGRWLNRDPIGEVGGLNVYVFCRNEPVTHVDLLGMIFCPVEYNENLDDESFRQARGNYAGDSFPYGFFAGAEVQFDRVSDRKKSRCGFFQTGHRYRIRPPLMCRGRIYTRKGSPSITKQHEEGHFKNYKDWFKKHEALWQSWENACVCKPCYDAVDAWIDKQSNVLRIERLINDKKLDITDYTKIDHSKSKIEDLQWELQILESALHTERGRSAELKRKKEIACK